MTSESGKMDAHHKEALKAQARAKEIEIRLKHINKVKGPFKDIRWFLGFFYITCFGIYGSLTHNVAITRTLEKRFGLSAAESGFILSMNDIINMVLVLIIGYSAKSFSKPRLLGIMCMIGGVGSMLFALPYPLFPLDRDLSNSTASNQQLFCGVPPTFNKNCQEETQAASNSASAYAVILAASALLGFGNSGLSVLSVTYIDENVQRHLAALYIGVASSAYTLGPLVSFIVSFLTLQLPENLKESVADPDEDTFIGAWWLAFLIWGVVSIVGGALMAMCPRHLPFYYEQQEKLEREAQAQASAGKPVKGEEKKTFGQVVKETAQNLKVVFTNVPYLVLVLSALFSYYMIPGLYAQVPKYLIIQFKVDQAMSSILTGLCGALVLALVLVIVGWVIKHFRLELRGAIHIYAIGIAGTAAAVAAMMPWYCDQSVLAGVIESSQNMSYYPACNRICNCTSAASPVCSPHDEISFISPCYAGCTGFSNITGQNRYTDCKCVTTKVDNPDVIGPLGGYVIPRLCTKPVCNAVIAFLFFFAFLNAFSAMTRLGGVMLQLRLVQKDMRPFALGLTSFIHNGLVFVPGPIVFGTIFDTTCALWQELECGVRGACIRYKMEDYRIYMHSITLGFVGVGLLFAGLVYVLIRPQFDKHADARLYVQADGKPRLELPPPDPAPPTADSAVKDSSGNGHLPYSDPRGGYDNTGSSFEYDLPSDTRHDTSNPYTEVTEL